MGYESLLDRDRVLLADFDARVAGIAGQPFWVSGRDGWAAADDIRLREAIRAARNHHPSLAPGTHPWSTQHGTTGWWVKHIVDQAIYIREGQHETHATTTC